MKSTRYSHFSRQIFGRVFSEYKKHQLAEKNMLLERANMVMVYEEYYAMVLMNILLGFIISFILAFILYILFTSSYTLLLLLMLPSGIPVCLGLAYLSLPNYYINKRGKNIDRFLPYIVNFMSTMSVAGISPVEVFRALSTVDVYGEVQIEAKKIVKEIDIMGTDNISALKHAINISPSKKFKAFLQGIVSTIQSGSDLHIYLTNVVEKYLEDDLLTRKKNLESLAVIAETFVISVIAFPLFLVIIISTMGFISTSTGLSVEFLFIFAFLILPLAYIGFYMLMKSAVVET